MKKERIRILGYAGEFAENKDIAKSLRVERILPALARNQTVTIDFFGVSGTTQSFIHALISEPIRRYRDVALENLEYSHCSGSVREVIRTVYDYMQESLDDTNL
ncbi:MAG: STAS-like domain-containing protein [Candidatus Moraniibacteriota bacterium]